MHHYITQGDISDVAVGASLQTAEISHRLR